MFPSSRKGCSWGREAGANGQRGDPFEGGQREPRKNSGGHRDHKGGQGMGRKLEGSIVNSWWRWLSTAARRCWESNDPPIDGLQEQGDVEGVGDRSSNVLLNDGAGESREEMEEAREGSGEKVPEEIPLQSGRAGELRDGRGWEHSRGWQKRRKVRVRFNREDILVVFRIPAGRTRAPSRQLCKRRHGVCRGRIMHRWAGSADSKLGSGY